MSCETAELFLVPCLVLVQELMEQQEALLSDHRAVVCNLTEDKQKLISVQSELQTNRAGNKNLVPPEQTLFQSIRGLDNSNHLSDLHCVCVVALTAGRWRHKVTHFKELEI